MLNSAIVRVVGLCVTRPWWTIALALALAAASSVYAVQHFAIKTDINDLISPDLPWAQRALHYNKDFPDWKIIVVVDAPTPENAERATSSPTRCASGPTGFVPSASLRTANSSHATHCCSCRPRM